MTHRVNTGGSKEFRYTNEDLERIRSEDTEPTREFKKALRGWRGDKEYKKQNRRRPAHHRLSGKEPLEKAKSKLKKFFSFIPLLLVIVAVVVVSYHVLKPQEVSTNFFSEEVVNTAVNLTVYENFSFTEIFLGHPNQENIKIKGQYKKVLEDEGSYKMHKEYLADDDDNTILLKALSKIQKDKLENHSGEVFTFSGDLKKGVKDWELRVNVIEKSEREFEIITKNKTEVIKILHKTNQSMSPLKILLTLKCIDGTKWGHCSDNQPLKCKFGKLYNEAQECDCPKNLVRLGSGCFQTCEDGTAYSVCSKNKPYFCNNGTLLEAPKKCGCPDGYLREENKCTKIIYCKDGTQSGKCAKIKPRFCDEGVLIDKASKCGCFTDYVASGEKCVSKYKTLPKNHNFHYILNHVENNIEFLTYGGLYNIYKNKPDFYYCDPTCPTDAELEKEYIFDKMQTEALSMLVKKIKEVTTEKDDQARIAISLVQQIPYDWNSYYSVGSNKYPYEVLHDESGVCSGKARLLVLLLKELGFGTGLLVFETESHEAVAIECPFEYSYYLYEEVPYCFVEAASSAIPSMPPYSMDYVGVGKITSKPEFIKISNGDSFDSISEEYKDALTFNRIQKDAQNGLTSSIEDYHKWLTLVNKYGMKFD
jgi:hypothetical protein